MRYGSVCSGIEAATVAWEPLGWEAAFFAEIAKFPRAVLKHHYPHVPLHGDFTTIKAGQYGPVDLLVGGTPCQSFSIAGLRGGLDDERGNLALEFLRLAGRLRPRWILWENVPGVLSSNGGRDFGSFLGGLGELGYGFAYRCLDAQYFGLAQRRLRVFVVGYLGDWRCAAAVLFEPQSLRWDSPPRRQSRQGIAPTISARTRSGGGLGTDFDLDGGLIATPLWASGASGSNGCGIGKPGDPAMTLDTSGAMAVAFGGNNSSGPIDIATALNASHTASGRQDFESETFITHALRADGFDASEDGTGRGTPIVPVSVFQDSAFGVQEYDSAGTLRAGRIPEHQMVLQPMAFSSKDHGADAGEIAPTLRAMGFNKSHANAGGQVAIAFAQNTRDEVREMPIAGALAAQPGMKQQSYIMLPEAAAVALRGREGGATAELGGDISNAIRASTGGSDKAHILTHAVRRLTPRECERLQGFPDDYTRIPVRRYAAKRITRLRPADMWEPAQDSGWYLMAPDGPRYMVLGNSMAVPVMRRIGERIAIMEAIINGEAWASKC